MAGDGCGRFDLHTSTGAFLDRVQGDQRRRRTSPGREPPQELQSERVDSTYILPNTAAEVAFAKRHKLPSSTAVMMPLETADGILDFSPEDLVARIHPRPLLLMAAQKDALMGDAVEETRRLFLRAGEPKQLVVLDGCDHYETYFAGFDRVLKHTMEFLESHSLAPPTPTTSTLPPAVASPVHGDTACHLDPWTFAGRWAILQETIQASHLPWSSQAPLGDEGAHDGNLMWGIALQMEWQFKSGRHSQFEDRATGAVVICPTAFWAAVNYFLSAALFLAAQQAGLPRLQGQRLYVDRVEELTSPDRARLFQRQAAAPYYNDAQRKATELWVAYFRDIAVAQALPLETFRGREEELRKELAGAMWRAHTASLHFATEACAPELHNLPVAEREFVIGFASTVDDIETEYLTTTSRPGITEMQYALFPARLLTASDPMNGPVPGFSETQSQFSQGMRRRGKKRLASKL